MKPKKRVTGRPRMPDAERRDSVITVMVNSNELETMMRAASDDAMHVAVWARRKLLDAASSEK